MSDHPECNCAAGSGLLQPRLVRRLWNAAKRWAFLNIWCRHCYRHVMRMLHRFDLHHAPPNRLIDGKYGEQNHWCQWCGLRGKTWKHDPDAPLIPPNAKGDSQSPDQ
jgi:hypothetical protein